jgi:ATP-binding cassette subfamily B protein
MPELDALPPSHVAALATAGVDTDKTVVAVKSDVRADTTFGDEWFVVTDAELLVLDAGGSVIYRVPTADVSAVRAETVVGGGILTLQIGNDALDIIRYSNACAARFGYVAHWLNDTIEWRQGKRDSEPVWDYQEERKFCKTCGLPLQDEYTPCPACTQKHRVFLRILSYLKPYKGAALAVGAFMLVSTVLTLLPTYFTRVMIDDVLATPEQLAANPPTSLGRVFRAMGTGTLALLVAVICLAGTHALSQLLGIVRGRVHAWLGLKLAADIRAQLYERLHSLSLRFFDKRQTGTVMSHITEDSGRLQGFLVDGLQFVVMDALMVVGIGGVLFWMNWKLAFFILIPIPLVVLGGGWFWTRVRSLWHRSWRRRSKLFDIVNDSVSGVRVVRAFAQEGHEIGRFNYANEDVRRYETRAEMLWATYFPLLWLSIDIGALIVWYVGGKQVLGNAMSLGTLMTFNGFLWRFYEPLMHASPVLNWFSRSLTAAERIFEVLDSEPEQYDDGTLVSMPEIKGEVEFRDVSFGYEPHKPVLKNINLHVKPGEMIGLVGHSGAGKSTMINLICRFYTTNTGGLFIDGENINRIRLNDLRRQIGVVLQEPYLFNGTVAENIAYAKPGATIEEIIAASKAANAHEFIVKFPDGYDTQVGERGGRLSGGERQRISIARAILHNPRILILDEATSSVDVHTEKKIQEAISRLVQNRTTFAIAHRLSTLRNANRLFVLEKGRGVETGTHEELMEKKGVYFKLVDTQRQSSEIRAQAEVVTG